MGYEVLLRDYFPTRILGTMIFLTNYKIRPYFFVQFNHCMYYFLRRFALNLFRQQYLKYIISKYLQLRVRLGYITAIAPFSIVACLFDLEEETF